MAGRRRALLLAGALAFGGAACGERAATEQPIQPEPGPGPDPQPDPRVPFGTPGPWPVENAIYAGAAGILESPVVALTTDEAQNRWIATRRALYLVRPGEKTARRYDEQDGLHLGDATGRTPGPVGWAKYCNMLPVADDAPCSGELLWGGATAGGIRSLAGGAPNEVFVGYTGGHTPDLGPCPRDDAGGDHGVDDCDPLRHSGKIDRVRVRADGSLAVDRLDFLSNDHGRMFWHDRTVNRLAYDHFAHPGTLYSAAEHGVTIFFPERHTPFPGTGFDPWVNGWSGDHLHARVCFHTPCDAPGASQRMGDWLGLAVDPGGSLWHAGKWTAGRISWHEDPVQWFARNGAAFELAFGDPYPTSANDEGFVNEPVFRVTAEGDPVHLSGVAVCPDGRVWFSSLGPSNGTDHTVAVWKGRSFETFPATSLGLDERAVRDIACLPDGRVVLAGASTGLALYDPATRTSKAVRAGQGIPSDRVLSIEVDRMVSPPSLHVATAGGAAVLRVLP